MSAQNPTPDDLRVLARNLTSEGQTSRGEVIANTAEKLAQLDKIARYLINESLVNTDDMADEEVFFYVQKAIAALTERVGRLEAERNEIAKAIRVTLEDGTAPDNLVEHVQFLMVEEYDPMMKRIDGLRAREICAGCGMKRIDAIKAVIKGAAACCPDCTTMTVDERNAVREALQEAQ